MTDAERIDLALGRDRDPQAPPALLRDVMRRVRLEATAPAPLAWPWRPALVLAAVPSLAVWGFALVAPPAYARAALALLLVPALWVGIGTVVAGLAVTLLQYLADE
jgi:hypothetical protein